MNTVTLERTLIELTQRSWMKMLKKHKEMHMIDVLYEEFNVVTLNLICN